MKQLRVIGDVHGHYKSYAKICKQAEAEGLFTVQLGDMGFSYGHFKHYGLDNGQHFWFGGNHDNYDEYLEADCCLGHYGYAILPIPFYFIRGAYSIDWMLRREGVSWWRDEELNMEQWRKIFSRWELYKPDLVITHDCPNVARDWMMEQGYGIGSDPIRSRTGQMLQQLFDIHQPYRWLFGHWHRTVDFDIGETTFQCIGELGYVDL